MRKTIRFLIIFSFVLLGLYAQVIAAPVELGGVPVEESLIVSPQLTTGSYSISYQDNLIPADNQFVLLSVKGVYSDLQLFTFSVGSIRYIDQTSSNAGSVAFENFIPSTIPNSTLLLGGFSDGPKIIGYIRAIPVKLSGQLDFYIIEGKNRVASVNIVDTTLTPNVSLTVQSDVSGSFSFPEVSEGTYDLTATANSHTKYTKKDIVLTEFDVNNISGKLFPGDVDGNGSINLLDLTAIVKEYSKDTTSSVDINLNGKVDLLDLTTVIKNYAKKSIVE